MSADRWGTCPKCSATIWEEVRRREAATAELYGEMDADEWAKRRSEDARRRAKLESAEESADEPFDTLREDYEVGVWGKRFVLRYSARCCTDGCGFGIDKNLDEDLEIA